MYAVDNELYALRLTFYEEAEERLIELEESLHVLSQRPDDKDILNSIFRSVHSIKGGSAACDHGVLTHFAHAFENLLSSLRKGTLSIDDRLLAVLLQGKDVLDALVCAARENRRDSEGPRVERSLATISAALALMPDTNTQDTRPETLVDLSAGFALWDEETEPSPASSVAPSQTPRASVRAESMVAIAAPPLLDTLSLAPKKSVAPRAPVPVRLTASPDRPLDGVVVRVGAQLYVLPTTSVERFVQPELGAVRSVPKTGELLLTEFGALPLLSLETLLGRAPRRRVPANRVAVVLRTGTKHVALLVDEVLTQGDVAVKCIEHNVGKVRGVCGAVVLDQDLALVLEWEALLASTSAPSLNPDTV